MSYSKTVLIGRLGRDPELHEGTQGRAPFCTFSLATTEFYNGKNNTEWHNVTAFGKNALNAKKYLVKGSLVLVEGKNRTRKYRKKNGDTAYSFAVNADIIRYLSKVAMEDSDEKVTEDGYEGYNDDEYVPGRDDGDYRRDPKDDVPF
jgi:single-strand DNA-binding protein